MMVVVVVMLDRQRIQTVHDHGGRCVWDARRRKPSCHRIITCSAYRHYTGVAVTARHGFFKWVTRRLLTQIVYFK